MGMKYGTTETLRALLAEKEFWTAGEAARRLRVSQRTLFRHIARLRDSGVDIEADRGRGGGIRLRSGWGVRSISLDEPQFLRLLVSLVIMEKLSFPLFAGGKETIQTVLIAGAPHSRLAGLVKLKGRIFIGANAPDAVRDKVAAPRPEILAPLEHAFLNTRALTIGYTDEKGGRTSRVMEPHGLIIHWPVWYVLAFDHLRGAVRTFRVDRIRKAVPGKPAKFSERARALFDEIGGNAFAEPL